MTAIFRHRLDPSITGSLVSTCSFPPPSFTLHTRESLETHVDGIEVGGGVEVGCDVVGAFCVPGTVLSNRQYLSYSV